MELRADSQRVWGSMSVAQTLAHCTSGLDMAMGEINPKRALANVVGLLSKPLVFGHDKPMRRNSPSSPELFLRTPRSVTSSESGAISIAAIDRFAKEGAACCSNTRILSLVRSNRSSGRF